jgi:hypothetical protein
MSSIGAVQALSVGEDVGAHLFASTPPSSVLFLTLLQRLDIVAR